MNKEYIGLLILIIVYFAYEYTQTKKTKERRREQDRQFEQGILEIQRENEREEERIRELEAIQREQITQEQERLAEVRRQQARIQAQAIQLQFQQRILESQRERQRQAEERQAERIREQEAIQRENERQVEMRREQMRQVEERLREQEAIQREQRRQVEERLRAEEARKAERIRQIEDFLSNNPIIKDYITKYPAIYEYLLSLRTLNNFQIDKFLYKLNIVNDLLEKGVPQFNNYEVDYNFHYNILYNESKSLPDMYPEERITNKLGHNNIPVLILQPDIRKLNYIQYLSGIIDKRTYNRYWKFLKDNERYLNKQGQQGAFSMFYSWFTDPKNESKNFGGYTANSEDINTFLINPVNSKLNQPQETIERVIQTLRNIELSRDTSLKSVPVDILLYRGFGYDSFEKVLSKMKNNEVSFSNFISTSWRKQVAKGFIGGGVSSKNDRTRGYIPHMRDCIQCCMMNIIVPEGSLVYIPYQGRNEKEIIFDRFARFKLINITYEKIEEAGYSLMASNTEISSRYNIDCKNNPEKLMIYHFLFLGYDDEKRKEFNRLYL